MKMQYVSSSSIKSVGYENGTLAVEFTSGSVYWYTNVPEVVYQGFLNAESKGKYIHKNVIGYFSYQKVR